jgi:uncharacterized protein YbjT (DUF2867 family)
VSAMTSFGLSVVAEDLRAQASRVLTLTGIDQLLIYSPSDPVRVADDTARRR